MDLNDTRKFSHSLTGSSLERSGSLQSLDPRSLLMEADKATSDPPYQVACSSYCSLSHRPRSVLVIQRSSRVTCGICTIISSHVSPRVVQSRVNISVTLLGLQLNIQHINPRCYHFFLLVNLLSSSFLFSGLCLFRRFYSLFEAFKSA